MRFITIFIYLEANTDLLNKDLLANNNYQLLNF